MVAYKAESVAEYSRAHQGSTPQRRKRETMSTELTLLVEGMTCQHCVNAVSQEVGALAGVEDVSIDVVPQGQSTLRVSAREELSRDSVVNAVATAGYTVIDE
jgi:copper chaperone CopZ